MVFEISIAAYMKLKLPVIGAARRWLHLTGNWHFLLVFSTDFRSVQLQSLSICKPLKSSEAYPQEYDDDEEKDEGEGHWKPLTIGSVDLNIFMH